MSLPEWLNFGKWTPFILASYVITAIVLLANIVMSYRSEKRQLREIALKLRRENRGKQ
jgi:heme exporter protein CcmD